MTELVHILGQAVLGYGLTVAGGAVSTRAGVSRQRLCGMISVAAGHVAYGQGGGWLDLSLLVRLW